jgi:hypothetical protein
MFIHTDNWTNAHCTVLNGKFMQSSHSPWYFTPFMYDFLIQWFIDKNYSLAEKWLCEGKEIWIKWESDEEDLNAIEG